MGLSRQSQMDDLVNPLIKKGMTAQLATRRTRIAAGERPLGWKVGLGSPTMRQKLGLQAPVVGFLIQRALLASGNTVSLRDYIKPVLEPEIGVRMARDLPGGVTAKAAAELCTKAGAAVTGFGFVVELGFLKGRDIIDHPYIAAITNYA